MSTFGPGDRVHIAGVGTGLVREARNGGRYIVEIKGQTMLLDGGRMELAAPAARSRRASDSQEPPSADAAPHSSGPAALDLHGRTASESLELLDGFVNDALLAGHSEVRVIHGRSGGAVKAAVHKRLRELPPVRAFRLDPLNPGVTIVAL
jgi:DNA mismatch repair protein MutS2